MGGEVQESIYPYYNRADLCLFGKELAAVVAAPAALGPSVSIRG
jgi:hypothetical protein